MTNSLTTAAAHPDQIITGPDYRITVLTPELIRFEHNSAGVFVDRPTQLVAQRRFPKTPFQVIETDESLEIITERLHVSYDKGPFTQHGLSVKLRGSGKGALTSTWHFGDPVRVVGDGNGKNLGGTISTLDEVDGATELEPGLLSFDGYAIIDDSNSVEQTADGWIQARKNPGTDIYFFGYGRDYLKALQDFFALTGASPLLPRWVLGNWWSRYHPYTAEEYLALMDRFRAEQIPFAVSVIDMDWHLTDLDPELGNGWTGYTWNTELFPDPPAFLQELHRRGLHTALNVHPADGVRRHEAAYPLVAADLGMDPAQGLEVPFDITNREFVDSYFKRLHHPQESAGVDFWWLDWQQGGVTPIAGLNPLWMLNHLHYRDSGRDEKRPLTFSRYAGIGSHRYPIGFSGDTVVSWESLAFQPYFTATAANVGYFWWSHDIGGHMFGVKDNELAARWYQLGVFSPINRLHSTLSQFNSKEPWRYGPQVQQIATEFLQLRHRLVPYLYSAMWQGNQNGIAPIRPMYHDYPTNSAAYEVPNQFMFGPDLLVAPITTPTDRHTHLAAVDVWLPDGDWYDFFSGRRYRGGRKIRIHRTLAQMPVFARAGSVIVLAADPFADVSRAPEKLLVRVFPGASGAAQIIEDDGSAAPKNPLRLNWRLTASDSVSQAGAKDLAVTLEPAPGGGIRDITVEIVGIAPELATQEFPQADLAAGLNIQLTDVLPAPACARGDIFDILEAAEIAYQLKEKAYAAVIRQPDNAQAISELTRLDLPGNLLAALIEIPSAS
jgi:alpha-glucosidase (family GH31 glycosyl hydrolase)